MKNTVKTLCIYTFVLVLSVSHIDCLTKEQSGMLLCVEEIISRDFTDGQPLVISMPAASNHTTGHGQSTDSEFKFIDKLLENIHKKITWPTLTSRPDIASSENGIIYKHQSYIILLWGEEIYDILNTLAYQLENINNNVYSFNRWAKFLIVVTDYSVKSPTALATYIIEILWNDYKIANSVIMIPNAFESVIYFDLYTWFPYGSGQCGTIEQVVLLDRCVLGKNRSISTTLSLFNSKIPLNIHGCPIRVSTWDTRPNMIAEHKEVNGSLRYHYTGIEAVYLHLLSEIMNMTIKFLPPPEKKMYLLDFFYHSLTLVLSGEADIAMGNFPLHYLPLAFGEPTIPYLYGTYKWYVQCARPIRSIDSLISLFTAPAWSLLFLIIILSAVTFWCIANNSQSTLTKEAIIYKHLSQCFNNAWAVFLGVSVAEMPKTFQLRTFFFLFVCYCFAINTVFLAYFTSFLIEPKLEKQIGTFDELKRSGTTYLEHPSMEELGTYMNYDKHTQLRRRHERCFSYDKCFSRLTEGEKVAMLIMDLWAEYRASNSSTGKASLCAIDENEFSMGVTMYLSKGSLFRDRFNVLIERFLEAGLGKQYWSELTWNLRLSRSAEQASGEAARGSTTYFAFTLTHLGVAFCLLAFGASLSSMIFVLELLSKLRLTRLRRLLSIVWNSVKWQ